MMRKTLTILCCALLLGYFSQAVSAGPNKASSNDGRPNGKPWQDVYSQLDTLQAKIDKLVGQVDSLDDQVAANENVITILESENADLLALINSRSGDVEELQEQIDNNTFMIEQLNDQIAQINEALEFKQNVISGSCPSGEAVSQINVDGSVVCQVVSGSGGQTSTFRVYNFVNVARGEAARVEVTCPDGSSYVGGNASLTTHYYYPYRAQLGGTTISDNTMTATAQGSYYNIPNTLSAYAVCVQ